MTSSNIKYVAVLAFPFGTHAAPLLSLIKILSKAAPDTHFSFFSTQQSNASLFSAPDRRHPNITPINVHNGLPPDYQFNGNPHEPVELFIKATPANFIDAIQTTGRKFTCIISDAFHWFAEDLPESLSVPWVPLWTAGPWSVLLHLETDRIRQEFTTHGLQEKTIDFLPGLRGVCYADIPEGIVNENPEFVVHSMLHNMGQALPRATAVVLNSFKDLDYDCLKSLESRLKAVYNVGPFALTSPASSLDDVNGCMQWLDMQEKRSVVYISFGSVITPPPSELEAMAEALDEGGYSFLWVLKANSVELLPEGFEERTRGRGKVVGWAPQVEVLQNDAIGVFLTHCGWNSVLESIVGGVPLICRPFFGDQRLNARIIESDMGIGVGIGGGKITKNGLIDSINCVLCGEGKKRMIKKLGELKMLARDAASLNGSSFNDVKALLNVMQ